MGSEPTEGGHGKWTRPRHPRATSLPCHFFFSCRSLMRAKAYRARSKTTRPTPTPHHQGLMTALSQGEHLGDERESLAGILVAVISWMAMSLQNTTHTHIYTQPPP